MSECGVRATCCDVESCSGRFWPYLSLPLRECCLALAWRRFIELAHGEMFCAVYTEEKSAFAAVCRN